MVGRLVPIKDHETFLNAARSVALSFPDAVFVVAGDGPLRADLEARGLRLLGDRVRFLGWIGDLPSLYAALDVVVLTSRNEGTPIALIEAGAAGKPVVATRVGGVADVVVDGSTGFLLAPGDAQEISQAIIRLLEDPEQARTMGKQASRSAHERFSARRLAGDLVALYKRLLEDKGIRLTLGGTTR
jgi:glycosyltransferase involved in cell wall biosynthesis